VCFGGALDIINLSALTLFYAPVMIITQSWSRLFFEIRFVVAPVKCKWFTG
jgi:hypothetical protein